MGFVTSLEMEIQSPKTIAEDVLALLLSCLDWFNSIIVLFLSKYLQHFDKSWLELQYQLFTGVTENVSICTSSDISITRLIASESAAAICYIIMSQSSYITLIDLCRSCFSQKEITLFQQLQNSHSSFWPEKEYLSPSSHAVVHMELYDEEEIYFSPIHSSNYHN